MGKNSEMIRMVDGNTVQVSLPSVFGYERIAMECSAAFARIAGFVSDRVEDLKTAVSEACLNAIEHGNKARPNVRVVVTISYNGREFKVEVLDQGEGFREMPKDPDIEKKIQKLEAPRGLGIFLIKNLMDHVEFSKQAGAGHIIRMIMRMRGESLTYQD